MFDYKNIEAFAMVVIEGGFEKASKKLHITQSAVSQRVRLLEEQYGQVLLKRLSPPEPTDSGLPLLHHYRKVKQLENDVYASANLRQQREFTTIAIAVNADTLSTWFYSAVSDVLDTMSITLDVYVDDQDATHHLMQSGHVWGCISTKSKPLQGCRSLFLGYVRYGIFATMDFINTWFPNGLSGQAFEKAPMARYNRKDDLNNRMFKVLLAAIPAHPPTFFIPSPEIYGHFVSEGRCYGILPEQQSEALERSGKIVNLSPAHWISVPLYWHCWNLRSDIMESFNRMFTTMGKKILRQQ